MTLNNFFRQSTFLFLLIALIGFSCDEGDDENNQSQPGFTCNDGIQNGGELATDCGGPNCPECECVETVTDIDGNVYSVVAIGGQCWMQSNLETTRYNNGDNIPNITDDAEWANVNAGAWCYYDNDSENGNLYGKLYNWYAVNTGELCPQGWRVPSVEEWETLREFVQFEGGALKSLALWETPNVGATNSTGFTALPSGRRAEGGFFVDIGSSTFFQTSSASGPSEAHARVLLSAFTDIFFNTELWELGLACRCIKEPETSVEGYNCISGDCVFTNSGAQYGSLADCLSVCGTTEPECNIVVTITSVTGNSATATASGGNPPYNYSWSNGATGATASGLAPGTYTVTASEVSNPDCSNSTNVTIQDTSTDNCCDCPPDIFTCTECCEGDFDMLGLTWAEWEAIFVGSNCDCN